MPLELKVRVVTCLEAMLTMASAHPVFAGVLHDLVVRVDGTLASVTRSSILSGLVVGPPMPGTPVLPTGLSTSLSLRLLRAVLGVCDMTRTVCIAATCQDVAQSARSLLVAGRARGDLPVVVASTLQCAQAMQVLCFTLRHVVGALPLGSVWDMMSVALRCRVVRPHGAADPAFPVWLNPDLVDPDECPHETTTARMSDASSTFDDHSAVKWGHLVSAFQDFKWSVLATLATAVSHSSSPPVLSVCDDVFEEAVDAMSMVASSAIPALLTCVCHVVVARFRVATPDPDGLRACMLTVFDAIDKVPVTPDVIRLACALLFCPALWETEPMAIVMASSAWKFAKKFDRTPQQSLQMVATHASVLILTLADVEGCEAALVHLAPLAAWLLTYKEAPSHGEEYMLLLSYV